MSRLLIILGILIVAYTVIAKAFGMPGIVDFMPVSWFGDQPGGDGYYRIVPSEDGRASWIFAFVTGIVISGVGLVLRFIR